MHMLFSVTFCVIILCDRICVCVYVYVCMFVSICMFLFVSFWVGMLVCVCVCYHEFVFNSRCLYDCEFVFFCDLSMHCYVRFCVHVCVCV